MGLRDIGASLPPGFRFYPSDEELVCHYLYKKIANEEVLKGTLVEIDLHTCEPWQLPEVAKLNATEWYFFSFRDRKYATGFRTNRATTSGYWKATGKDRVVVDPGTREVVGMRKTLVFYRNRAPHGIKTGWIMHEFRLETPHMPPKEDWVLCRVFHKSKTPDNTPPFLFDTAANRHHHSSFISPPSPPLTTDSSAVHFGYHPQQIAHHNILQYNSQEKSNTDNNQIEEMNKCGSGDDEYGFLWDMNLEDNNIASVGVDSNMEDIRFELDNSMVFI